MRSRSGSPSPAWPMGVAILWLCFLVSTGVAWGQDEASSDAASAAPPSAAPTPIDTANADDSLGAEAPGGVGQLSLELQPDEITIGDRVEATLTLVWMGAEPSEPPRFPTWQETWGGSEVLAHGEVTDTVDDSGRRIYRQQVTLTSFEVGDVTLPTATVIIPLGDHTIEVSHEGEVGFQVLSVLPEEATAEGDDGEEADADGATLEPRPAAAPRPLTGSSGFLWLLALLALCVVAAAFYLHWRVRRADAAAVDEMPPWMPPLTAFLSQLNSVDPDAGSERTHTAISLALRRYLTRRLRWNAAGATTSEIQRRLRTTRVTPPIVRALVDLLKECDQVKFARQEVSPSVNADRLARAREMGRSLEALLQPPPVAAPTNTTSVGTPPSAPPSGPDLQPSGVGR